MKFIIEKDGSINQESVVIAKSINVEIDAEAIRIVKSMPNWTPAMQDGVTVRNIRRVPVKFSIPKPAVAPKK